MASYPSSMTDSEWNILDTLLPPTPKPDTLCGRPQQHSRRSIVAGILYIILTTGSWRMMPNDLPNWKTCHHYFQLWTKQEYWERIHHAIWDKARLSAEKKPGMPHLSIVKSSGKLARPKFVVMMRVRRLHEENDTFHLLHRATSSP